VTAEPSSAAPPSSRTWRPPISAVLVLGFGGLVAGAVAAVLLLALDVAQRNTSELLRQTAALSIDAQVANLDHHLRPARNQVEFLANQLSAGAVPLDDDARLRDLLLGSLAAAPQLSGVAFVRDDLHSVRAGREGGAYGTDTGSWLERPEVRLAVRNAAQQPGFTWGDILYIEWLHSSFIIVRMPVRQAGQFRGVVMAVVSIGELSNFIAATTPPTGGRAFVLRGRDEVIAHPALIGRVEGLSADKPLPHLNEVGDNVLAAMWTPPIDDTKDILGDSDVAGRIVSVGVEPRDDQWDSQNAYIFLYREIRSYGSVPWLVGFYIRLDDVNAPIRRLISMGIVGGGITLAALLIALLLGRSLGRPIRRLAAAAEAIRDLSVENVAPLRGSPFRELDVAARAFNSMLGGLRWFQTYVPRVLVLQLMGQAQGELESKQRVVTVLFTDIVGFTEIGGRLPAPQLAEFLNRHFGLLGACIDAEQGTVDKYIGDSIMAFWGAPLLQADHAHRACRAAKAIAATLKADNDRRSAKGLKPVRLRIGIHTAPVVVGNVGAPGRVNYTLIGDTVNTAQRLEALGKTVDIGADDVVVLLSGETADFVGDEFQLRPLGEYELRGRSEKLRVYQLL
jgi:class 3 adenylate cyclase